MTSSPHRDFFGLIAFTLLSCSAACAQAAPCYDVSKGEPRSLSGVVRYIVFPGPPNFEDVQRGDTPEPTYVLNLDRPICVHGDEFTDPKLTINAVHLVGSDRTWPALRASVGKYVIATLHDQMGAFDGHHHEPLVAWVTSITPAVKPMDFVEEYGTGATTVRAFYETLGAGRGEEATKFVVPEKRVSGPFAAPNLTKFYGQLTDPIRLLRIDQAGPNTFVAHYRYAAVRTVCEGASLVTIETRGDRNYIKDIKALKGG